MAAVVMRAAIQADKVLLTTVVMVVPVRGTVGLQLILMTFLVLVVWAVSVPFILKRPLLILLRFVVQLMRLM